MRDKTHSTKRKRQGMHRADLAVYTHRVLALLRPLDTPECDAVLRAAEELNRAERIRSMLDHPAVE